MWKAHIGTILDKDLHDIIMPHPDGQVEGGRASVWRVWLEGSLSRW